MLPLQPCRECRVRVSTEATVCPRCGCPSPTDAPTLAAGNVAAMASQPAGPARVCPFCVSAVPDAAVKCDSCGADLSPESWRAGAARLYSQPVWHLVALSIATFGLYHLYWFYRSWRQVGEYSGKKLSPGWRTAGLFVPILGIVFVYDLFDDVRQMLAAKGMQPTIRSGWLLVLLIGFSLCWRLPDLDLLGFLAVMPLAIVQADMNRLWAASAPDAQTRKPLTALEIGLLIVGAIVVALILLGMLLPE